MVDRRQLDLNQSVRVFLWFQTRKALLDTELDIMKKEQSGVDTSSLQQKVAQLKNEVCARRCPFVSIILGYVF